MRFLVICVLPAILIVFVSFNRAAHGPIVFQDNFEQVSLDTSRWEVTMDGDFAEAVVDVVDLDYSENTDSASG